jgi:hypothetical protein
MLVEILINLIKSKATSQSLVVIVDRAGGRWKCSKWSAFSVKPKIDARKRKLEGKAVQHHKEHTLGYRTLHQPLLHEH